MSYLKRQSYMKSWLPLEMILHVINVIVRTGMKARGPIVYCVVNMIDNRNSLLPIGARLTSFIEVIYWRYNQMTRLLNIAYDIPIPIFLRHPAKKRVMYSYRDQYVNQGRKTHYILLSYLMYDFCLDSVTRV